MVLKHILRLVGRPLLASLCQNTCAFVFISDIISRYGVECVESYGPIQFDVDCSHGSNVVCSPKFILILVSRLCSGFVRLLSMTKHKGDMPSNTTSLVGCCRLLGHFLCPWRRLAAAVAAGSWTLLDAPGTYWAS